MMMTSTPDESPLTVGVTYNPGARPVDESTRGRAESYLSGHVPGLMLFGGLGCVAFESTRKTGVVLVCIALAMLYLEKHNGTKAQAAPQVTW